MSRKYTWTEINSHNKPDDLYLVIRHKLYNVTKFQYEHPGGPDLLLDQGGKNVTELFDDACHSDQTKILLKTLEIGSVGNENTVKASSSTKETNNNEGQSDDDLGSSFHLFMTILVVLVSYASFFYYQGIGE
ncbi:hypothetical protein B7463_g9138, partial [Scytalidium lignicola]